MKSEINLLPQELAWRRERRAYFVGLGRFLQRLSLLLALLIVGEVVVYIAFSYLDRELTQASIAQQEANTVINEVERVNALLAHVEETRGEFINWSLFVEEVLNSAPAGIQINKMRVEENEGILEIDGFSSSHSAVLDFQNILKTLSWVIRVDAPLQNYALGYDTGFSFNLVVTEKSNE